HAQYVLADPAAQLVGTQIAADTDKQMILYRVNGPLRTATNISGWYPDTWTGPTADWLRRSCKPGELRLPVRSDPILFAGVTQHLRVTGTTTPLVVSLPSTKRKTIVVPLRPVGGICRVHLAVTPSRSPGAFPTLNNPDPRTLGVLLSGFQYVPSAG